MTVGELKKALSVYVDDTEVITKKTEIFGNVGYVHRVKVDAFAFFGRSIPCVLLTDDFEDDCEDSRPAWHPLREVTDSDTISRQAAIDLIERYCDNGCEIAEDKWCPDCQRSKFAEMIKALPPSPSRPKGKWIPQNLNKSDGMISTAVYYYPKCSVCGANANYTNFCPNCGADMRP